jgi:hypothetical protein
LVIADQKIFPEIAVGYPDPEFAAINNQTEGGNEEQGKKSLVLSY